jgi:hypothetical protein
MKQQQPQAAAPFTLNSDFSKIKLTGQAAMENIHADLAIFDLMEDGVRRTVTQVEQALVPLGYNRRHVNNRMVNLLYKKKTFVADGNVQGAAAYVIKKGAKRPIERTAAVETAPIDSQIKIPPAAEQRFKPVAAVKPSPLVPTVAAPTVEELSVTPTTYVVEQTDPVQVAIWKTMHDHESYTVQDLATLLDHISLRAIESTMKIMNDKGMFEVTPAQGRNPAIYTLIEGVPMPEGLPAYHPRLGMRKSTENNVEPVAEKPVEQASGAILPAYQEILDATSHLKTFTIPDAARLVPHAPPRSVEGRVRRMAEEGLLLVSRPEGSKSNVYEAASRKAKDDQKVKDTMAQLDARLAQYQTNATSSTTLKQVETQKDAPQAQLPLTDAASPADQSQPYTPGWENKLDELAQVGTNREAELAEQARQEELAAREAAAEEECRRAEAAAQAAQAAKPDVKHFKDPAPVKEIKPGVFVLDETPLVQVGGIFVKGKRFSFKEAVELLKELEEAGFGEEIEDFQNDNRKYLKLQLMIADLPFTPIEAQNLTLQLKKELS